MTVEGVKISIFVLSFSYFFKWFGLFIENQKHKNIKIKFGV